MRIVVLLNEDLPALYALNHLQDYLARHQTCFFLSRAVGKPGPLSAALRNLKAQEQGLVKTVLNRLPLRPEGKTLKTFPALARHFGCEGAYLDRPRSAQSRDRLRACAPEVVVSIRYGGILDADHVALAPHGILNLHSGALPAYRGVLASFRAVAQGEAALTATLHRIVDDGIDTGPLLSSATLPYRQDRALLSQIIDLYAPGCALIEAALTDLEAGLSLPGTPQPEDGGAYYSKPTEEELRAFAAAGHRLCELEETLTYLEPFLG